MKRFLCILLPLLMILAPAVAETVFCYVQEWNDGNLIAETMAMPVEDHTLLCADLLPRMDGSEFTVAITDEPSASCTLKEADKGLAAFQTEKDLGRGYYVADLEKGQAYVFDITADYTEGIITGTVYWRDQVCGLMTAAGAQLGQIVSDESGYLTGFVCAEWGEGVDQYVVVPAGSFKSQTGDWFTGVTAEIVDHKLHISWADCDGWDPNEPVSIYRMDVNNDYYGMWVMKAGEADVDVLYVPGRTYWLQVRSGEASRDDFRVVEQGIAVYTEGPEEKMDQSFTSRVYLGFMPAGTDQFDTTLRVPEGMSIDRNDLTDPDKALFMQVINTYDADTDVSVPLVIALTAPTGNVYWTEESFMYLPGVEEDPWMADLSELLKQCAAGSKGLVEGEYNVSYYVNGWLADSFTFVLENE